MALKLGPDCLLPAFMGCEVLTMVLYLVFNVSIRIPH